MIVWQVTSCSRIFENGSLPLIHGRITTLLANRATKGLRRGSFTATRSQNGNRPNRVPFFGSTANVGFPPSAYAFAETDANEFPFRSGRRKECTLVC
jgi:hypothetical protein